MKRILLILVPVLGGCVLLSCLAVGGLLFLTRDVASAGDEFMEALRNEQFSLAYEMMHPALQSEYDGYEGFQDAFREIGLNIESWRFTSRSINNDSGELSGQVTTTGQGGTVFLALLNENDQWFISSFRLTPDEDE
ncbi:MAG: hypothetical protein AAGD96_15075 [Chloroflexota bacterium]